MTGVETICSGCGISGSESKLTHCPGCSELVCDACGQANHMGCIASLSEGSDEDSKHTS